MTIKTFLILTVFAGHTLISCNRQPQKNQREEETELNAEVGIGSIEVEYKSENLIIRKISPNVYEHTSFLSTDDFGKVPCNGMIVVDNHEAIVFDTPSTNEDAQELITYLTKTLNCEIKAVVATHFHADCIGGLKAFHDIQVPSYANTQTIRFAKEKHAVEPIKGFVNRLELHAGDKKVYVEYVGEGHTKDNIVGYFPDDNILFGGCLIKELGAEKGNLEDANTDAWPETVKKVKSKYPQIALVIPGHGEIGGIELLDYTIELFN